MKNTYLGAGDRRNLQFRVEFFNLFNQVNFRQPFSQEGQVGGNYICQLVSCDTLGIPTHVPIENPFFGQILQAHDPRTIQFALKFVF